MQILFNKTNCGACPFCKKRKWCAIHSKMEEALALLKSPAAHEVEAVIYVCPAFDEEF